MKSLVGNGKDFKFNSKINRKPMEIFKNRCNVAELCESATSVFGEYFVLRQSQRVSFSGMKTGL